MLYYYIDTEMSQSPFPVMFNGKTSKKNLIKLDEKRKETFLKRKQIENNSNEPSKNIS